VQFFEANPDALHAFQRSRKGNGRRIR